MARREPRRGRVAGGDGEARRSDDGRLTAPSVADNPQQRRFEITVDGALAGFAEYRDHGNRRTFTHTEIDPSYEGQGLGSTLVKAVLDDARANGREVLPVCPFVRSYVDGHRDYLDLVPVEQRERFGLAG